MNNLTLIYKELARGPLDIRVAAHEENSKICFDVADLLHNTPGRLVRELRNNTDYTETLDWIRMRARQKNLTKWLDMIISENDD
jgi:hypothetical protein